LDGDQELKSNEVKIENVEHDKNVVKESEIPPENKEDKECEEFEQNNKTQETQKEVKDEKLPFETRSLKNLQNGFANSSGSTCYIGCVLHVKKFFFLSINIIPSNSFCILFFKLIFRMSGFQKYIQNPKTPLQYLISSCLSNSRYVFS